ncbi:hypothetical protein HLV38_05145 [Berryella wangjianweii]|uniref:Lipoprotein n=2 Tax=Berryella wangjianweii TaxID=2734634 RepID=A0A6M8J848_9ACTN|nr:hypothetical protein [Berryella wangjianweii]QKF07569.1 hypothetical protein HLV38_05145 [Berryella wangjianweii]
MAERFMRVGVLAALVATMGIVTSCSTMSAKSPEADMDSKSVSDVPSEQTDEEVRQGPQPESGQKDAGATSTAAAQLASDTHFVAQSFQFDIPQYWAGKVDVKIDGDQVLITPKDCPPTLRLVDFTFRDTDVHAGGDVGNSWLATVPVGAGYVHAWLTRSVFLADRFVDGDDSGVTED